MDDEPVTGTPVMIVDDNAEFVEIVTTMLERRGHSALSASNLGEAIALLESSDGEAIRLVLMDYHIPGDDPVSSLARMRRLRPELRIVICTGSVDDAAIDALRVAGGDEILAKPFRFVDLDAILENGT